MINFFRKIRQKLLQENRFSKYLLYAVGEIILVVIGILIALGINNWNEDKKKANQLQQYRISLITELNADLSTLNQLENLMAIHKRKIEEYIDYYNQENVDIFILGQKKDSIDYAINTFNKSSFILDELNATGNISLFSKEEKESIAKLKNSHEIFQYYERKTLEGVIEITKDYVMATDNLYENKYSKKQHISVKDWQLDLNSEQYRLYHNLLYNVIVLFNFQQSNVYPTIREDTETLLKILDQKLDHD
ncbi:DUF6090 family protein [Flagellimonas meishanensis]|uniref:DUF6090 family protein n=1 Tax=Flagellimonas meishanensis TaxID=2873264 RepID=UPI001CA5FDA3|nr:DUF6090 family protein [[Muricauda] meishanensis]